MTDPKEFDWEGDTPVKNTLGPPPMPPHALTHSEREHLFGRFEFEPAPMPGDPERVRILGDWVAANLVTIPLPKIGPGAIRHARVHRLIAKQFASFWQAVEAEGLLRLVLTFDGAYYARYKRGRARTALGPAGPEALSNHSWGTAFDLNAPYNAMGTQGSRLGEPGSVRRLIPLARKYGFLNGLQFSMPYTDAMHFEAFQVM